MLHAAPSRSRRASAPHRVSATPLLSQVEARAADCDVTAYVLPSSAAASSETPTAFGHLIVLPRKCLVAFVLVQTVDALSDAEFITKQMRRRLPFHSPIKFL